MIEDIRQYCLVREVEGGKGMSYFKLDGVTIKSPTSFKIERYRITEANRLANGDMSMEQIAKKRKLYLTWESIEAAELNKLLDIIWESDKLFYRLDYFENGTSKWATVYSGQIPSELHRTDKSGNWVWKGVELHFIER